MEKGGFLKTGLTSEEAKKRLEKFGPNKLARPQEFSGLRLFFSQFKSPLVYILVFAGVVTLFLREFTDSIVIFAAVFLNTLLGFWQERKAQKALSALRSLLTPKAKVIREGRQQVIEAADLVPGDLVVLTIGSQVPADGVLVEAKDFSVDEAILTGESMPVAKQAAFLRKTRKTQKIKASEIQKFRNSDLSGNLEVQPAEFSEYSHKNKVFMGTTVTTGIGKMIVVKTGRETEVGRIGKMVGETREEKTPLQEQLSGLARVLAIVVGAIALFIFGLGEFLGYEPLQMFTTSVAVAVAAIPEGLVVTLTVILALGMQRILKRKAIVRRLLAAETLGSVSTICVDKTGTLTEGKMRVVRAATNDQQPVTKEMLAKAAVLCNDMRDPLEVAMWEWAEKEIEKLTNLGVEVVREQYPRLDEIPFSPKYKYIATLHSIVSKAKEDHILFLSGAPEVVLSKCQMSNGKWQMWLRRFEKLGNKGYRLVGFAYKKPKTKDKKLKTNVLRDFKWLGVLLYEDPLRPGVAEALKECQKAGIKVKVITGDYKATAQAVMAKLGWSFGDKAPGVVTGEELKQISEEELQRQVGDIVLFARTSPQQKLKIVQALKNNGEVVAMTGDGVNDAPALKSADIGIVVGEATDVAKETADIVLLDSNFATIVAAVEEGRTIFENIKKVVLYLLSDSFTEIILIGGSLLLRLPLPVTAAQILWVNLIEDTLPGIALAFEPEEKEVMLEPPRPREAPILDLELKTLIFIIGIFTDLFLLALFYWLLRGFLHLHYIQTVMFVALGIDSLFYVLACRSLRKNVFQINLFSNKLLLFSLGLGFLFLALAVYLPFLQTLLRTHALGGKEWLFLFGLGTFNLLAIELTKWIFIIIRKGYDV